MKLYEFEGHRIFAKVGIISPYFIVCQDIAEIKQARKRLKFPLALKAQVLAGKRGKSGGIKFATTDKQLEKIAKEFFESYFAGEKVRFISLSQKVKILEEYYLAITYDTTAKAPFLLFSEHGGADIEEVQTKNPDAVIRVEIDPLVGLKKNDLAKLFPTKFKLKDKFIDISLRLWDAFTRFDARLVEINPLALIGEDLIAVDAKIILDDNGLIRHKELDVMQKGAISAIPTGREIVAKKIDQEDYRGSAGSTFIELEGDIAILASGGGASLLVMDSLITAGAKPANYTEYSGNPPAEKVEKLTKITLSKENLAGCLVAGAVANFTDIYETLKGFADALITIEPKPQYPIVIRRGGPRQQEAYQMLEGIKKTHGFDIHLLGPETPISVASQKMAELSKNYKMTGKES